MEKINIIELKDNSWEKYFLLEALTTVFNHLNYTQFDGTNAEISLTINGVECPFIETVREIGKQHKQMIEKEAIRLLQEKFQNNVFSKIENISQIVTNLEQELINHLNGELNQN